MLKQIVLGGAVLFSVGVSQARNSDFVGTWIRSSGDSSIMELKILATGLSGQAFRSCDGTPCYPSELALTTYAMNSGGNKIQATSAFVDSSSGAHSTLVIELQTKRKILVREYQRSYSATGVPDTKYEMTLEKVDRE